MFFLEVINFDSPFTSGNKIRKQYVKKSQQTNKNILKQKQVKNLRQKNIPVQLRIIYA